MLGRVAVKKLQRGWGCSKTQHRGSKHFLRNKSTTQGGPDGGNGGRGGHIILKGNKNLWTLLHLKYRKHIIAADGEKGGDALKTGAEGKDEILEVPLGTVARDEISGEIICEITKDGQEIISPARFDGV